MVFILFQAEVVATTVYCVTAPEVEGVRRYYFNNCSCTCEPSDTAKDPNVSKAMWEPSEKLVCKDVKLHWSLLPTIY